MNSPSVIPKKQLSSFQKWELGSFETNLANNTTQLDESVDQVAKETISLPTAEQIEAIYQQAKNEGYQAGYQEGKQHATVEMETTIQHLQVLMVKFEEELQHIDQTVAQELLELAIEFARKIVTQSLELKPELIIPIIQDAIQHLPSAMQPLHIILHPEDATLVRIQLENQLSHSKWKIYENSQIERGGCKVEAGGCEIDATLASRWKTILSKVLLENHQPN
ncbi:MAG TPA: flagellar assembly protein FliH [Nitrosomonas sp.]|nr:flagellar assembly protein FliH [Nitrosomonas sp.]HMW20722.1 flagellar assembly protein FliH [Nitrosomonas sp.]HMW67893.1 flagellar assembly protein FliH [Nitrosomonas sp.]HMY61166.1 flagellar assembly protein FliH [Nitrosomonas sp.]HMY89310.1 flagellar assembly protein FliH [Nitrosomonas sp.]